MEHNKTSIIYGVLDLLMVWLALGFWTRSKRVHIGADGVWIRGGRFGWPWPRFVPKRAIAKIEPRVMLEAETLMLHDLDLVQTDGRHLSVGIFIQSKQEAAWLAGRMRELLERH